MFLAHRTRRRLRAVLIGCVGYVLVVAVIAALFPREAASYRASFGWWLLGLPVVLALGSVLEVFGTWGLGLGLWRRIPSWARILLLVALISLAATLVVLLASEVKQQVAI